MDVSEIKDRDSLQTWLETLRQEETIAIWHRISLRVAPLLFRSGAFLALPSVQLIALILLRCNFTSGVAREWPTPEIKHASRLAVSAAKSAPTILDPSQAFIYSAFAAFSVDAATSAAGAVNDFATSTAASAYFANRSAYSNDDAFWHSIRIDATALLAGTAPLTLPLWPDTPPDWFTTAEAQMRAYWAADPTLWLFWQRWWDAATAGRPLDWQLQHDIALIPNDIWQSGPGPVAEAIAQIEAAHQQAQREPTLDAQLQRLPAPTDRTRNIKFVVQQVTLLQDLIEDEYEYLRGHNGRSATEQPLLDQQRATLQRLRDLVKVMLVALEGDPSPSTALTVVNETLPAVADETQTLIDQGAKPQVSAQIYAIAAAVKVLTESGVPGDVAAKIAYAEEARGFFKRLFRR